MEQDFDERGRDIDSVRDSSTGSPGFDLIAIGTARWPRGRFDE
jgi:hypothetical protein